MHTSTARRHSGGSCLGTWWCLAGLLAAGAAVPEMAAEVAPENRTPYLSTYYIRPKVPLGD